MMKNKGALPTPKNDKHNHGGAKGGKNDILDALKRRLQKRVKEKEVEVQAT